LPETGFPKATAALLNQEWEVDAVDYHFHGDGHFYQPLRAFPDAYFDRFGYVVFPNKRAYTRCKSLSFGDRVHVEPRSEGIASLPGYQLGKWRATPQRLARLNRQPITQTVDDERRAWLRVRIHHNKFAIPVKARGECALTGLKLPGLLDACHIRPWKDCSSKDKLDPLNGLCLATHIHKAFDLHLLGITPEGAVHYSEDFSSQARQRLGLADQFRIKVLPGSRKYLKDRFAEFLKNSKVRGDGPAIDILRQRRRTGEGNQDLKEWIIRTTSLSTA
jgi:hypothetical protein